jgi:hypothetical protein
MREQLATTPIRGLRADPVLSAVCLSIPERRETWNPGRTSVIGP